MVINDIAKNVFKIESQEILNLSMNLTDDFTNAVESILKSSGKLIISGMGKSGIIGKKIAATLASTGTPSFFLHPGEAYHGDLGMIEKQDVVLLISNSGETDEVLKLIPFLKSQQNITISMSGNPTSTLAKNTNFHLNVSVQTEACPLQLAPTSSTTATLVMGDALAVALMNLKSFQEKDFAQFHPGGSLGRKLLTKVKDVMIMDNLPICNLSTSLIDVIHIISKGGSGVAIISENNIVKGIITDGDLRRMMEKYENNFFNLRIENIMTKNPKVINEDEQLINAQNIMTENRLNILIVIDLNKECIGILKQYQLDI